MRSLTFLLALLCLGMALYIMSGRGNRNPNSELVEFSGGKASILEILEEQGPPLRDESGAILELDPGDDFGGFVRKTEGPIVLPTSIGERSIHLLELYGQQDEAQLRRELAVLQAQFDAQRSKTFDAAFASGHFQRASLETGGLPAAPPRLNGLPTLTESRPSTDPETQESITGIVVLQQRDHPELYELQDTIAWLDARLAD